MNLVASLCLNVIKPKHNESKKLHVDICIYSFTCFCFISYMVWVCLFIQSMSLKYQDKYYQSFFIPDIVCIPTLVILIASTCWQVDAVIGCVGYLMVEFDFLFWWCPNRSFIIEFPLWIFYMLCVFDGRVIFSVVMMS